eukprot:12420476-Karenia_brevis.AAC.1
MRMALVKEARSIAAEILQSVYERAESNYMRRVSDMRKLRSAASLHHHCTKCLTASAQRTFAIV